MRPSGDLLSNVLVSAVVLGAALAGFFLLPFGKSVLWLLFLLIAYPPALAITAFGGKITQEGIIEMYRLGLTQVPLIGSLIGGRQERSSVPGRKSAIASSHGGVADTPPRPKTVDLDRGE